MRRPYEQRRGLEASGCCDRFDWELYNRIDIALDTFPYNGHTTTLDGLWMGVPAVTLVGDSHVSRLGLALCRLLGLEDLAARSEGDYHATVIRLASDLPRLAALRAGLRERMRQSPLCDGPRLARAVEAAYRDMWRKWCGDGATPSGENPVATVHRPRV